MKKAGTARMSSSAVAYLKNQRVKAVLRELTRLSVLYADYSGVKTIAPKHVASAHRTMTGRTLLANGK